VAGPGDVFKAYSVVREPADPASGEPLGVVEERHGDRPLVQVQEKFSLAGLGRPARPGVATS
jgi:hypothetical protein